MLGSRIEVPGVEWYVYIVRCGDGSLYTGTTHSLSQRVAAHNAGRGGRYTRAHLPVTLEAAWRVESKAAALTMEAAIKRLGRPTKLRLISGERVALSPAACAKRVA